jgi:hypothetical protein
MPLNPALAALDASLSKAAAIQAAKSPEQVAREYVAGQIKHARDNLKAAKDHRAWREALAGDDPSALLFFGDRVPALMAAVGRHRKAAHRGRARLAALVAAHLRAA